MGITDRFKGENEARKTGRSIPLSKINSKAALAIAIIGGIVTAILAWLIPTSVLESITGATGLSEIIPATGAPLGSSAKTLFIIFSAIIMTILILVMLLAMRGNDEHVSEPMTAERERNRMPVMDNDEEDRMLALKLQQQDEDRYNVPNSREGEDKKSEDKKSGVAAIFGGAIFGGAVAAVMAVKSQFRKLPFMGGDDRIRSFDDLPKLRDADKHPDAPARRPLSANKDLGEKIMSRGETNDGQNDGPNNDPNIAKQAQNIENEDDLNEILNVGKQKAAPIFESQASVDAQNLSAQSLSAQNLSVDDTANDEQFGDYAQERFAPEMQPAVMQSLPIDEPADEPSITIPMEADPALPEAVLSEAVSDASDYEGQPFSDELPDSNELQDLDELPEASLARQFKPAKSNDDDSGLPSLDSLIARMERVIERQRKNEPLLTAKNLGNDLADTISQTDEPQVPPERESNNIEISEDISDQSDPAYTAFEEVSDDEQPQSDEKNPILREVYSAKPSNSGTSGSDDKIAKEGSVATQSQKAEMDSALKSALETLHKMAERSA